jgi:transposase-like protein
METPTKSLRSLIEFATGILSRLNINFVDEEFCRQWTLKTFHPSGAVCPYCGLRIIDNGFVVKFYRGISVKCPHCSKWFKATTETFLEGAHLSFSQVVLMLVLIECNQPTEAISKLIGADGETVRRWRHKVKMEQKQRQQIKGAIHDKKR